MFVIFPKKIEVESPLTVKQCRKKLRRDLVEYQRKPSLIAASRFIKRHKSEDCLFGSVDGSKAEIFCHRAKKHDGSSAGFFGRIEKNGNGSKLVGHIRRTAAVTVCAVVWTLFSLLVVLSLIAMKEYEGAVCVGAIAAAGFCLITWDTSEKKIREYLSEFSRDKTQ